MQSWLDRAEQEHDNFRAALGWLIVHHETDAAQQLAADLKRFWNFRGHLSEGRVWLRRALDLPGPATLARARAFDAAGNLAREQSDFTAMRPLMEAALATAEAVGDLSAREYAAAGLADLARFQGDLAAARAWFEQAAGLARRAGDQTMFGLDLHNLGRVAHDTGDYAAARALNEQALRIFEDTGYVLGTAFARNVLGWLSYLEGNSATGGALLERALRTCREIGERRGIGENLYHLAHVALERRDLPLARARLRECLLIEQALGQPRMIAFAVEGCARLATTLRRHELALCLAGAAATLRTAVGAPLSPSECRWLERWLAPARSALSPASRAVVWAAGQALSAEEACAEALALTVPASRPGTASPAGLTAREVEVLRLLAGGRSNKEIAACLVLGVRTVERHVANVYAKIGARGRTEATSFALRTGVVPAEVG
jgi:DNA-binding CsgD family transcriptional regulator/tetratricopeptide (TPR) repeat protein